MKETWWYQKEPTIMSRSQVYFMFHLLKYTDCMILWGFISTSSLLKNIDFMFRSP